ncbi:MAG TPA: hypothetical protein VFY38_01115 [Pseudonocardia sp.]|nr:hypothetical protein [Pseudonocardia sp.]
MTVSWSGPDGPRSGVFMLGPDLEEEFRRHGVHQHYLARPTTFDNSAKIDGPGIAEIKPHTKAAINDARAQLNTALAALRNRLPALRRREALIITYRPVGKTTGEGTPVEVYAVRYVDEKGTGPETYIRTKPWWNLGTINVPRTTGVNLVDRSVFGAVAERAIRAHFGQVLGKPPHSRINAVTTSPGKSPNEPGSDVEWTEIADMYAELARTTNDEFLAELANELAALR